MRWLICLGVIVAVIIAGRGLVKAPPRPSMGALKGIVTLHTAEAEYHLDHGRFAPSLQELGGFIDRDLAAGEKDGYRFTLVGTPTGYAIAAAPEQYGGTGSRTYFSDQSMRIHVHDGPEPATAGDPLQGETGPPQQSDPVAPRRDKTNS